MNEKRAAQIGLRQTRKRVMGNDKGYTLAELIVVMGIFVIVMIITAKAFDRIISSGGQQAKSSASQIEGLVGVEMLRADLSHAGYGLPWSFQPGSTPNYAENASLAVSNGISASAVSDNPATATPPKAPRAIVAAATTSGTNPGSDYLVIKSALLALSKDNPTVGRWGSLVIPPPIASPGDTSYINTIGDSSSDLRKGIDYVITIKSSFSSTGAQSRELMMKTDEPAKFSYQVQAGTFVVPAGFWPTDPTPTYIVYGISSTVPTMPYNRADYYVYRPPANDPNFKIPASCNSGTGILFKAVADQQGGFTSPYPLLNCVGDMKVVFSMDWNGDGSISYYSATNPTVQALSAADLRSKVKDAAVYILAHEGKMDRSYSFPSIDSTNAIFVGPYYSSTALTSVGRMWTNNDMSSQFGPNWRNYRWKVYAVPSTPKNLGQ